MKISKIAISSLLVLSLFLTGCETVKDITDPLDDDNEKSNNISSDTIEVNVEEINLYFVRPADPLTIGQDVELYVDDDEIGELTYNTKIQTSVKKPGTYELATKVGWSFSAPVTGLGGACKYEGDFKFTEKNYYFKVVFDPGLLCGEHEIIGILESEYLDLVADID
ncbi:hypothetical protein OAW71_04635 [Methylophilaceae bacterium]|nr:hypothetical protein [Methylophilaceae bacterium]